MPGLRDLLKTAGVELVGDDGGEARLRVDRDGFSLAELPREALEELARRRLVVVEMPGRIVYVRGSEIARVLLSRGEG